MVILNVISNLQNRLIVIKHNYSETQLKRFIINTLTNDGLDGKGLSIPYSKVDMEYIKALPVPVLNIVIYYGDDGNTIGEYTLNMRDENFCAGYSLPQNYIEKQVDRYWDIIKDFITENLNNKDETSS